MDGAEAIDLNVTLRANARCARVGGRGGRGAAWAARPRETSPSADLGKLITAKDSRAPLGVTPAS
jgi:hypothetical protein